MPLSRADVASLSRLLDQAMALDPAAQQRWLDALPPEQQRHAGALRAMLARQQRLDLERPLESLPRLADDEAVARAHDIVGPYRLLREIGRGGMGIVWLAERSDGMLKRQVALKLPRLAWGAGLAERMARERDIAARLEHPNIARLYDAGVDERGRPFLALEFVDGQPIDAWCEARALDLRERLRLFVQVARALAYAHGRLVVHRDLKPSNVLVTADGQTHLLDFGIAKLLHQAAPGEAGLTQDQGRMLTPQFASPEQVAGEPVTVQSDVYSLGVLLYDLLTGSLPIRGKRGSPGALEDAILAGDAPPASSRVKDRARARALRGELDAILAKAMQREPRSRYATADALADDIERHLRGETVAARPDSLAYRLRKALRRHWVGVGASLVVLVALLAGSSLALVHAQRAALAAERERVVKAFVADVFRLNGRSHPLTDATSPGSSQGLLEGGAQLIQQRFAGQPELQAELFGVVAGVLSDMGAYKLAIDCAARRIEVMTSLRSPPIEQAQALLSLAQAMFEDRRHAEAEPLARRALALSTGNSDTRLEAIVLLGRLFDAMSQHAEVDAIAATLAAELARGASARSPAGAWLLFLRARVLTVRNRFDDAMPLYDQAIDTALQIEGARSMAAIDMRLSLARRLAQTTRADQAPAHLDAAVATLQQLGGAHAARAAFASADLAHRRFDFGFSTITADQASAALERSRAALASSPMPIPAWFTAQIDFWRGSVLSAVGNLAAGWPLLESASAALGQSAQTLSDRWSVVSTLGVAAMHAGRHDLARGLLQEQMAIRRQQGMDRHPYAALDHVLQAENLLMAGATTEADAVLDSTPHFEPMRGEGLHPDRYNRIIAQARARVRLATGQIGEALRILQAAPPDAADSATDWANYQALLGEALCAGGRHAQGLAVLKQRAIEDRRSAFADAPWLARLHGVTGLCALAAGDRREALRYAGLARSAFGAQPQVSPYYKAPLRKLEQALRRSAAA